MTRLPVNATNARMARLIAEDAARTQTPSGLSMTIGALVDIEDVARPFSEVALAEPVPSKMMHTFVFEATVGPKDRYVIDLANTADAYGIASSAVGLRKDAAAYLLDEAHRLRREAEAHADRMGYDLPLRGPWYDADR